jgi:integrase
LHVVPDVLGHASIANTEDVYGHLMEGDKRAATEAISALSRGNGHGWLPKTLKRPDDPGKHQGP